MDKLYPQVWMAIPKPERQFLAQQFDVQQSGISEIRDGTHLSDGKTEADLSVFTKESMASFVGQEVADSSFMRLLELSVAKAYSELNPPVFTIQAEPIINKPIVHAKEVKKIGRPSNK